MGICRVLGACAAAILLVHAARLVADGIIRALDTAGDIRQYPSPPATRMLVRVGNHSILF
jgi:hypothetical protein